MDNRTTDAAWHYHNGTKHPNGKLLNPWHRFTPGLMPLRADVPLPPGVRSARDLRSPSIDWDRLAEADRRLTPQLGLWPTP